MSSIFAHLKDSIDRLELNYLPLSLPTIATFRVRFLDNFSAGELLSPSIDHFSECP